MAVVNNGFLVSYEFAVLITHFGKMHLFHGKVLIGFIRPDTVPKSVSEIEGKKSLQIF